MNKAVFTVIGYDRYYPSPDNVLKVFISHERAVEYLEEAETGKYSKRDYYDIVEYVVED